MRWLPLAFSLLLVSPCFGQSFEPAKTYQVTGAQLNGLETSLTQAKTELQTLRLESVSLKQSLTSSGEEITKLKIELTTSSEALTEAQTQLTGASQFLTTLSATTLSVIAVLIFLLIF